MILSNFRVCSVALLACSTTVASPSLRPPLDARTVAAISVSKGEYFACALTSPGRLVYCWGSGAGGVLGKSERSSRTPVRIPLRSDRDRDSVVAVSAGATPFACALFASGQAYCWGQNDYGEIGDGTAADLRAPSRVRVPRPLVAVSAGENVACGLADTGEAYCWGINEAGQLGVGDSSVHRLPVLVKTELRFRQLSVGAAGGTCGVTMDHRIACWGRNDAGQLGTPDDSSDYIPRAVLSAVQGRFDAVDVGNGFACALGTDGHVVCWGSGLPAPRGEPAGNPATLVDRTVPIAERVMVLSSGFRTSCVVTQTQRVNCWGSNGGGMLARPGAPPSEQSYGPITSAATYSTVSVGGAAVCAITSTRALDCWGAARRGAPGRSPDLAKSSQVERIIFK